MYRLAAMTATVAPKTFAVMMMHQATITYSSLFQKLTVYVSPGLYCMRK
jgi:hypothetical protein